ncbi:SH3 domain-containing protein [Acinetobacter sp. ANC 4216]|uniref:SH3 domain-containing protein n=1 Tax=Acinetobacter sp. ANC 4216 TaxID=2529840 RepID=UPI0013F15A82|nr:SH3 domain-containing protein [Acinetobacter sp. ANC 4216]
MGFGSKLVWGAEGKAKNAPQWLRDAAESGWAASRRQTKTYKIVARDGLFLRSGPSLDFNVLHTLPQGTLINIDRFEGVNSEWGRVDLVGDGQIDGFIHSAFVESIEDFEIDTEDEQDFCEDDESSTE